MTVDRMQAANKEATDGLHFFGVQPLLPVCLLLIATPGPIEAASNTETTVMQEVQAAIIAAAAEETEAQTAAANAGIAGRSSAGSSDGDDRQQSLGPLCLDRTERLANSLGKMAATVQQLNEIPHECSIMLMAGKQGVLM